MEIIESIKIDELRSLMKDNVVSFVFEKKDGTKREALGTLNENKIPDEILPKEDHVNTKASNFKYFDLEKNGWRSLSYDTEEVELKKYHNAQKEKN